MSLTQLLSSNNLVFHSQPLIPRETSSFPITTTSPWSPFHGSHSLTITSCLSSSPPNINYCWTPQGLTTIEHFPLLLTFPLYPAWIPWSCCNSFPASFNSFTCFLLHCIQLSTLCLEKNTAMMTDLALNVWTQTSRGPLMLPAKHTVFIWATLFSHLPIHTLSSGTTNTSSSILTLSWWPRFLLFWADKNN